MLGKDLKKEGRKRQGKMKEGSGEKWNESGTEDEEEGRGK